MVFSVLSYKRYKKRTYLRDRVTLRLRLPSHGQQHSCAHSCSGNIEQSSAGSVEIHFHAVRSIFRYHHATIDEGIYYWRTTPRMDLPKLDVPTVHSNPQDILMDNRPNVTPNTAETYVDPIGAHVPKPAAPSAESASDLRAVRLHTNQNSNPLSRSHLLKQNLWQHAMPAR